MIIDDRNKLQDWLDQNYWFEDGFISKIYSDSFNIEITLGIQIRGTYVAGEPNVLKEYIIIPNGIKNWNYDKAKYTFGYDGCMIDVKLAEIGFGLKFGSPYNFEIVCDSIEISEPKIINTFTKPWISDNGLFVTVHGIEIPRPQYWIDSLKNLGFDVGFRYYSGELKQIVEVPYPDYSGFFIQQLDRIIKNEKGIFFKSVAKDNDKIGLAIELEDNEIFSIWKALQKIISTWENVQVDCGNVAFTGNDWKVYLDNGKFPEHLEKIKNVW